MRIEHAGIDLVEAGHDLVLVHLRELPRLHHGQLRQIVDQLVAVERDSEILHRDVMPGHQQAQRLGGAWILLAAEQADLIAIRVEFHLP